MLSNECRRTLFVFLDSLGEICQESQSAEHIEDIANNMNKSLALLERDFPLTLQNITTHLLHHITDGIKKFGPVYATWMFVFERFNSWLCKRCLNMRYPEATAIETYLVYDWCQFMHVAGYIHGDNTSTDGSSCSSGDIETVKYEQSRKTAQVVKLGKKKTKSLHAALPKPTSDEHSPCLSVKKYYKHVEKHNNTSRRLFYSCPTAKQSVGQGLVAPYICTEFDRGIQSQKLKSNKYVHFGRILYFLEHTSQNGLSHTVAFVKWFPAITLKCNDDTQMWYTELNDSGDLLYKSSYMLTSQISPPLITATEQQKLWFINSGKHHSMRQN